MKNASVILQASSAEGSCELLLPTSSTIESQKSCPIHCNSCCVALCCVLFHPLFVLFVNVVYIHPQKSLVTSSMHHHHSMTPFRRFFRRHFFQCSNVSRSAREGTFPRFSPKGFEKPRIEWVSHRGISGFQWEISGTLARMGTPLW